MPHWDSTKPILQISMEGRDCRFAAMFVRRYVCSPLCLEVVPAFGFEWMPIADDPTRLAFHHMADCV